MLGGLKAADGRNKIQTLHPWEVHLKPITAPTRTSLYISFPVRFILHLQQLGHTVLNV
jgi:hypothetical protein